ncbi:undecaprenyl-phosphate glucose phosphotransferase [Plasticicumulans acidivorans]|uniref:Putative colanic acid biosynthesis UDP-glucose lipid carrier transferase n=1 Tax=Plasticicumulans acidivorans TaxID=886464 RepID=A0A317MRM1_9GAMM|nr:undecaprenyl-phosphate glucose phosphotransferase [Plasticicumulans acidivorans]PWV58447.1 putative colanic acid biosynthesis UDP-glucose lipid carrier transferase [Plasticicumulans acidivorans]
MKKGFLYEHSVAIGLLMRVFDLFAIVGAALLTYWMHFDTWEPPSNYVRAVIIGVLLSLMAFDQMQVYRAWRGTSIASEVRTLGLAWTLTYILLSAVLVLTEQHEEFARRWLISWYGAGLLFFIAFRSSLRHSLRFLRSGGRNTRRVVVAIVGDLGFQVIQQLQEARWTGLIVVGYFEDRSEERVGDIYGVPRLGNLEDMAAFVEAGHTDQVWLTLPFRAEERMRQILVSLRHCTADIRMVPDIFGFSLLNHSLGEVAGIPVINLSSTPMVGVNRVVKAIEDRVIASIILLLISPLMICVALGIKLTSAGPVFFRQERLGYDGRVFRVWKFRSMKVHQEREGKVTQAKKNDSRITPFGAFLRRTSLDELPQFFNVLDGSMSIVGPRPHAVAHNEEYKDLVDRYMRRHKVKPGITGWAQVNGFRGETDTLEKMEKRVEYDLYYIEHWSLLFDLKIIFMTIFKGFVNPNAY